MTNISYSFEGRICFSMLDSEWSKDYRLEHFINGLLWLLQNPNPSSALNGSCVDHKTEDFNINAKMALAGFTVKGIQYPKAVVENFVLPAYLSLK